MTHAELVDARSAVRASREAGTRRAAKRRPPTALATAIIPARGGSKGLPGKNLARVGGVPLVVRAVLAALAAERIGRVVVTTDDAEIADAARTAGADVIDRPAALAVDTASSEAALIHAIEALADASDPARPDAPTVSTASPSEITVFIQATSPFIDPLDLDRAIARVTQGERDVVFAASPSHVFLWREGGDSAEGVNHDAEHRPRRQDREPEFAETGAFYVFRTAGFLDARHRFFGRIGVQPVSADHALEIDDAADLARARALAPSIDPAIAASGALGSAGDPRAPYIDVDAVVTDFDGVHTDDTATVDDLGRESVRVSRSDGAGIARLREAGIPMLILSAEANPVVARRAEKLGVECRHGVADKGAALAEWAEARGIRLDRIAYLGNDRGDLPALESAGWPVAVHDAVPDVLQAARLVLERPGGRGAVRELADLVLRSREHAARSRDEPATTPDPAPGARH